MKPIIKIKKNSSILPGVQGINQDSKNITYELKGTQQIPDEVKKFLVSLSAIFKIELLNYLQQVSIYLKMNKGSKFELEKDCQKFINLLSTNKGEQRGTINRDIGGRNSYTRGMDGFKKR